MKKNLLPLSLALTLSLGANPVLATSPLDQVSSPTYKVQEGAPQANKEELKELVGKAEFKSVPAEVTLKVDSQGKIRHIDANANVSFALKKFYRDYKNSKALDHYIGRDLEGVLAMDVETENGAHIPGIANPPTTKLHIPARAIHQAVLQALDKNYKSIHKSSEDITLSHTGHVPYYDYDYKIDVTTNKEGQITDLTGQGIGYVTSDNGRRLKIFNEHGGYDKYLGKTRDQVMKMEVDRYGLDGVSGATACAKAVKDAVLKALPNKEADKAPNPEKSTTTVEGISENKEGSIQLKVQVTFDNKGRILKVRDNKSNPDDIPYQTLKSDFTEWEKFIQRHPYGKYLGLYKEDFKDWDLSKSDSIYVTSKNTKLSPLLHEAILDAANKKIYLTSVELETKEMQIKAGDELSLPKEAKGIYNNGQAESLPITWGNTPNLSKPGQYIIEGKVAGWDSAINLSLKIEAAAAPDKNTEDRRAEEKPDTNKDSNSENTHRNIPWQKDTPSPINTHENTQKPENKIAPDKAQTESNKPWEKFADIEGHWAIKSIHHCLDKGYFKGSAENLFEPNRDISRAEWVTVLGRRQGVSSSNNSLSFTDVNSKDYFAPYVAWAVEEKIVFGQDSNTFAPHSPLSREQLACILDRYLGLASKTDQEKQKTSYADQEQISSWAKDSVERVFAAGLMQGKEDSNFDPQGKLSRGEAAQVLFNLDLTKR